MPTLVRALVLVVFGFAAPGVAAPPLAVHDGWIRATPPGARTAAAYLTISNLGSSDRLLGATTAAAAVEIHTQAAAGGQHRMVRLPELALPSGATVRFEPGGLHLMLTDLATPLVPGTVVSLALEFAVAGTVAIDLPVVDARVSAKLPHGTH